MQKHSRAANRRETLCASPVVVVQKSDPAARIPMLGGRTLPLAGYGQTGDVHDDVDGAGLLRPEQDGLKGRSAAGQGLVGWRREIEIREPEDAADESLGLPEREAQNGPAHRHVTMARSENFSWPSRRPDGLDSHPATASGESQRVTSPRAVSARS